MKSRKTQFWRFFYHGDTENTEILADGLPVVLTRPEKRFRPCSKLVMKMSETKVWFPAKKYGWGWGPPCCWQGWVAMIIWVALLAGGGIILLPAKHVGLFVAWT